MTALILAMLLGSPRCWPVPATGTDWQLFVDVDGIKTTGDWNGYELIVRGVEQMDGHSVPVRLAAQAAADDCVSGGWGPVVGIGSIQAGKVVFPGVAAAKGTIETYNAGVRVSSAALSSSTTCANRGILGDFNNDGKVDLADYAKFQTLFTP